MTATIKTEHPHIVRVPGVAGGRPVITGTRISVEFIARYPHLSPAAVYDAISYYFDHQDEIDREIEESTLEAVAERYELEIRADGRVVRK